MLAFPDALVLPAPTAVACVPEAWIPLPMAVAESPDASAPLPAARELSPFASAFLPTAMAFVSALVLSPMATDDSLAVEL